MLLKMSSKHATSPFGFPSQIDDAEEFWRLGFAKSRESLSPGKEYAVAWS
jgi:hypothetical protein